MLIDARLRHDRGWSDAVILNISRRGLMACTAKAPPRGTYIEVCRGTYRIVARVVWVDADRFGAQARDPIAVDFVTKGEAVPLAEPANVNDRRQRPRKPDSRERAECSRRWSRAMEFVAVTAFACAAGFLAFDAMRETLGKPMTLIGARLG